MRLVDLLLKEHRYDEAINLLKQNKKSQDEKYLETSFNYTMIVWRVLNFLAEAGDPDTLKLVFDTLIDGNYILPNNIILGPLIKVHLAKDDIKKAMETFEFISEKYKCTPWKNELACRLIQAEDAVNLQKLTDLSTNIHGEVNSLYDLVFSFIECGRIRQARKILETPGLRMRPQRIDYACERYTNEGMVQPLEGLVEATKDLSHIDRNKIYYSLLLSYCKVGDVDKGLGLWTKMQEENITPTDNFLIKLSSLLQKNNIKVPFVVPEIKHQKKHDLHLDSNGSIVKSPSANINSIPPATKNVKPKQHSNVTLFRKAVNMGEIDAAIAYKHQLKSNENLSITDISNLIENLVRRDRLSEAIKYVHDLLDQNQYPIPRIFKFLLNKIVANGDIESLVKIGKALNNEQKKLLSFDNRLCHAYIIAGKVSQYLNQLDDEISNALNTEDISRLAEKFPRGGALGILNKHPEMLKKFEQIAEKYAEANQLGPMNVLWMHLISKGDETASKLIWEKYLSSAPRLMFQRVLQTAREQKDDKLAKSVINQLRESKISEGAIGNAYSCLIDIHITNGSYEKALETLHTAIKDVCLENINRTALQRLQSSLAEIGQEFPYTIPEKRVKNDLSSSSTSSSDDDITPKRPEMKLT